LIGPLRRAFMAGRAIVLVDGWDELPSDERGLAAGRLAEAMGAVAGNVWLVAAGERGYAPLVEAGLAPLRLAPWQAAQSDALAERWAASFRDAIPAAPRVLWTELRRATRAGASPMELALRAFVYLSTQEDLPRRAGALFERAADLLLSQPDSAWLLATCHATLGRLALALFRERCRTLSRAEVEAAIRENVSSSDESPTRSVAIAFRVLTGKRGMLRLLPQGRLQFIHSRWQAYFAARELVTLAPTDLAERLDDPRWAEVFAFYAEFGDMGPLMSAWLSRSDDLTRSRLRALARWVSVAPEGAAWREQATALLAKTLLQPQLAHPVRRALAEDLAVTGMPGVSAFLGKLLAHPNAEVRIAALRGLGRCGAEPEVTLLEPALGDADVRVCQAALDALAALNLDAAAKALAGYLAATSNDELRPAAAEALAHCGGMGRALLREAAASDNVMVRRAAVFGLAAARERLLLERVAREDTQWIVRSAAVAVLAELDAGEQEATGVPPMPEADDLAWLISWTAGRGQGVERGTGARHMLLCALREGQPAAQLAALETLALIGRPEDVPAVEPLLRETDSGLAQAAFEVMAEVSQRYDLRLAAQGAQQTLEQHSE